MVSRQYEQAAHMVKNLSLDEQLSLMELLVSLLQTRVTSEAPSPAEEEWDEEELAALLNTSRGLTTQEIVAEGLLGGWEDEGIEDGQAWVDELRGRSGRRYTW